MHCDLDLRPSDVKIGLLVTHEKGNLDANFGLLKIFAGFS